MILLGNELGRVVILAAAEEWRPPRGIPVESAVSAIQARYNFMTFPNLSGMSISQIDSEGYKFEEGVLNIDREKTVIRDFIIFKDGVSVTAHDTAYAEAFLDDFFIWARETLGIRPFLRVPPRIFRSQLIVQFGRPLSKTVRQFEELASIIGRSFASHTPHSTPVNLLRLDFGVDQTQIPGIIKPLPLVLERRVNRPHADEVYFSEAPLPSQVHFEVLEQIEGRLS